MVMVNYENVNEGDHKWKWEGELEGNGSRVIRQLIFLRRVNIDTCLLFAICLHNLKGFSGFVKVIDVIK